MTPNSRFAEFITDINPSPTTNARSQSAHNSIRDALSEDADYKDSLIRDFLGGSYKRQTAIRPATKGGDTDRPDVDIYVVVEGNAWTTTPEELIDDLFNALQRNRKRLNITHLMRNRCSIAISTNSADMDISPLLDRQSDSYYRIGNRTTGEWYATDPEEHTNWSSTQNATFSGRFKPTVKLLKWARRENPTRNKHPKSFCLEVIVAKHMSTTEDHYGKIVHGIFEKFVSFYAIDRSLGTCPTINDPAIPGGDLLTGVSGDAFCAYYDKIKSHRDDAAKALEAGDQDKATMYWRRIFGSRFPASNPGTSGSTAKSAAVISPLTFPSKPAQPSKRPAKFA